MSTQNEHSREHSKEKAAVITQKRAAEFTKVRAAVIISIMRRQPYDTRGTAAVTTIKIRVQLSTLTHKIDRPQPFSQETRQQCKTAVIMLEGSRGSHKREGSHALTKRGQPRVFQKRRKWCEMVAVIDTKETEP